MVIKNMSTWTCLMAVALLGLLGGCSCERGKKAKPGKILVVNVLDKEFYDDCHIKGSINVPFMQVQEYAVQNWDKDQELVFYCTNFRCTASGMSAKQLQEMGYQHVYAYEGGMAEWHHLGNPVEGPCKNPYLADYEKPSEPSPFEAEVRILTAEQLKKKIEESE